MESEELTRAIVALPAAAVIPSFVPALGRWFERTLATVVLAMLAVSPLMDRWEGFVLVGVAIAGGLLVGSSASDGGAPLLRAAACAVGIAIAAALVLDAPGSVDALRDALHSQDAAVVVAGGLMAVFVGGALIAALLAPYTSRLQDSRDEPAEELIHAGLVIGWLERSLLYAFVVAGAPGAVPLVVAAKSIARYPSFSEGRFGDYFLIGTLASVVVAVGAAMVVRAILGLSPLLA